MTRIQKTELIRLNNEIDYFDLIIKTESLRVSAIYEEIQTEYTTKLVNKLNGNHYTVSDKEQNMRELRDKVLLSLNEEIEYFESLLQDKLQRIITICQKC